MGASSDRLIEPEIYLTKPVHRAAYRRLKPVLNRFFAIDAINDYCQSLPRGERLRGSPANFFDSALELAGISYGLDSHDWARLPKDRPVVCLANHPFGAADGLVLGSIMLACRQDSRLLSIPLLENVEGLARWSYFCSPKSSRQAILSKYVPLRKAYDWLNGGHCLGLFPSGRVSRVSLGRRAIVDPPWNEKIARLIRATDSTVVPIFFSGRNSLFFQMVGLLSMRLQHALVAREFLAKQGSLISARVGNPISPETLASFSSPYEAIEYLRRKTYELAGRSTVAQPPRTNQSSLAVS